MAKQLIHTVPSKRWLACGDTMIIGSRELSLDVIVGGKTYNQFEDVDSGY